jgi:hypothetical protein
MTAEVIKLVPEEYGDHYKFLISEVLSSAGDIPFTSIVICGYDEEGNIRVLSSETTGETVIILLRSTNFLTSMDEE